MSMQTLTWDVDAAAAVAGNSDGYSLALATQARQKPLLKPKLLILVSFFSQEDTPSTNISHYIPLLPEVCRFIFLGHPV